MPTFVSKTSVTLDEPVTVVEVEEFVTLSGEATVEVSQPPEIDPPPPPPLPPLPQPMPWPLPPVMLAVVPDGEMQWRFFWPLGIEKVNAPPDEISLSLEVAATPTTLQYIEFEPTLSTITVWPAGSAWLVSLDVTENEVPREPLTLGRKPELG